MIRWWKLLTSDEEFSNMSNFYLFSLLDSKIFHLSSFDEALAILPIIFMQILSVLAKLRDIFNFKLFNYKKENWQNSERERRNDFSRKHPAIQRGKKSWKLIDFFLGKSLVFARKKKFIIFFTRSSHSSPIRVALAHHFHYIVVRWWDLQN